VDTVLKLNRISETLFEEGFRALIVFAQRSSFPSKISTLKE
jgi:hypothetical protein